MSLLKKYKKIPIHIKAAFWFLVCSFLQKGISVITTPIFTRLLSTEEYGRFNVFNSWLNIVAIFVSMYLYAGVYSQGIVKFSEERDKFSSSLQGLTLTLVLIWTIVYLLFYNFWNSLFSLSTLQMLLMLLMIWTTAIFNFWSYDQRAQVKYRNLVLLTIIVSILKPVISILLIIYSEDKVLARILGLAIVEFFAYIGLFIYQMYKGKKFCIWKYWKYALLFNLPLIPHYLSQVVLASSDRIMISRLIGDSEAGIYSLAYSLSLIMTLFNSALMQTLSPWIYQKIKKEEIKGISSIGYLSLIGIAIANLMLILFAPELIKIFAPKEYYDTIFVIPPISMSVFFMYCYDLFAKFAFYKEKTKTIMFVSVIGAFLNIILNYIFIPKFGYVAAGYTTLVCYIIYSIGHYMLMKYICNKSFNGECPYSIKSLLAIVFIFLSLGFIFMFTYNNIIIRYMIIIIIITLLLIKRRIIYSKFKEIFAVKRRD